MEQMKSNMEHGENTHELHEIGELIKACGEGGSRSQLEARTNLEQMGDSAVEPLIHALLNFGNPVVRWRAAEALGHIGDTRAIDPLIQALGDENYLVQWRVIEALADIGEPAMERLDIAKDDGNAEVRWNVTRAMKDIREKIRMEGAEVSPVMDYEISDDSIEMCMACGKCPAVNYGYCLECSGRRGFC
ncbi:MAG: HEAT repeat domain-containing protein [Thermoplasmata archaeon]